MLRPRLQRRINHFYRNCGRENNNHERIYLQTHGQTIDTLLYFQSPQKNLFPLQKKKINEKRVTNPLFLNLIELSNFDRTNNDFRSLVPELRYTEQREEVVERETGLVAAEPGHR